MAGGKEFSSLPDGVRLSMGGFFDLYGYFLGVLALRISMGGFFDLYGYFLGVLGLRISMGGFFDLYGYFGGVWRSEYPFGLMCATKFLLLFLLRRLLFLFYQFL